jgi:hypothetical protein
MAGRQRADSPATGENTGKIADSGPSQVKIQPFKSLILLESDKKFPTRLNSGILPGEQRN